ncbi:hypothetical protein PPERSA_10316 [Pseudocohnilembus persalinus]|uniref:Uncharacterized protein n=1 Tax=Pseudocohnilembus persalinus TaxID=266149 RepID=A0A0V0R165_PSEPJ|nr:hypothetical protein PPERSA_10316 [Pseudocohnilembus persalinus]|eukprot:KRX07928.1 hypothetical protein PPERSA_10316 [Pseudocohnilembus persalinus]
MEKLKIQQPNKNQQAKEIFQSSDNQQQLNKQYEENQIEKQVQKPKQDYFRKIDPNEYQYNKILKMIEKLIEQSTQTLSYYNFKNYFDVESISFHQKEVLKTILKQVRLHIMGVLRKQINQLLEKQGVKNDMQIIQEIIYRRQILKEVQKENISDQNKDFNSILIDVYSEWLTEQKNKYSEYINNLPTCHINTEKNDEKENKKQQSDYKNKN